MVVFVRRRVAFFYGNHIAPEELRFVLWATTQSCNVCAILRIRDRSHFTHRFLLEDGHIFDEPDGPWYGWLLDLAREHGWEPHRPDPEPAP
jgi:hypothetical protein